jgi:hypothetical protein
MRLPMTFLIVLQDAESAFTGHEHLLSQKNKKNDDSNQVDVSLFLKPGPFTTKTNNSVHLHSLSGIVQTKDNGTAGMEEAQQILARQKFLQQEHRKVIIAACLAYQRSIRAFQRLELSSFSSSQDRATDDATFLGLLQQHLGDACNEAGKILLNALRTQLSQRRDDGSFSDDAAHAFLSSADFWFTEGLDAFQESSDLQNLVLLRCNLCQCYKLRANALFDSSSRATHAEECLQEAANQLEAAHDALGERGTDRVRWDMVSAELAAAFLDSNNPTSASRNNASSFSQSCIFFPSNCSTSRPKPSSSCCCWCSLFLSNISKSRLLQITVVVVCFFGCQRNKEHQQQQQATSNNNNGEQWQR